MADRLRLEEISGSTQSASFAGRDASVSGACGSIGGPRSMGLQSSQEAGKASACAAFQPEVSIIKVTGHSSDSAPKWCQWPGCGRRLAKGERRKVATFHLCRPHILVRAAVIGRLVLWLQRCGVGPSETARQLGVSHTLVLDWRAGRRAFQVEATNAELEVGRALLADLGGLGRRAGTPPRRLRALAQEGAHAQKSQGTSQKVVGFRSETASPLPGLVEAVEATRSGGGRGA